MGPYDNNPSCHCSPDTPSVIVQVTDQCPECSDTHFDLNPAAMDEVVGDGLAGTCGIIETLVRRVNCDIQSNIKIRSKSGTSGWWYGLHVDDVAGYGDIASVRLKGFGRGDFDIICDKSQGASFWACTIPNAPVRAPVGVELTDSAGRVLVGEDVITNLNGNQEFDFGSNFAAIPTGPPPPVTPNPTLAPVTPTLPPTGSPTITPSPTAESVLLSTTNAMSAWDVFQGLNHLTKVNSDSPRSYALVAGGGAAGNGGSVVTESQAYALLITGTVLASWDTHAGKETTDNGADRSVAIDAFEGYFNFWKKMCQNSVGGSTCQGSGNYCYDEETQAYSVCLPDWKQKADGSAVEGTGPAPDGDEDAIVGIILAVKAVENDSPKPSWYDEARKWADASATAFFEFNVDDSRGDHRLVKLGACWGGWDTSGNNPSYHSPGSYKAMRDFQKDFPSADRHGYEPYSENEWNKLIDTSHEVLRAVQCSNDGAMVPNWATVSISNNGSIEHSGGSFSGSGTPQYEYGAEAARTTWRVALDAALYPGDSADWAEYLDPYLVRLRDGHTGVADRYWGDTFSNCRTPNTSQDISIFGGWLNNAFIYAPTLSALIAGAPEDALLVDDAGSLMAAELPGDYYPRCWALLGNLMLNGAMESAGATALSG